MKKHTIDNLFDNIPIMQSNPHYRLGDIILQVGARWRYDHDIILHNDKFKQTLLRNYIEYKSQNAKIDIEHLKKVVLKQSRQLKTDDNTLYINIRMGDIVMNHNGEISTKDAAGKNKVTFLYNKIKLMDQIFNVLQNNNNINRIQIVTALHFGDNKIHNRFFYSDEAVKENRKLFNDIINDISMKFNLPVCVNKHKPIDQIQLIDNHTLVLSYGKHVIHDNSGFGRIINLIRSIIKNKK